MYGVIYKATNLINGKIYIGKTTQNFEKYKLNHINSALRNSDKDKKVFYRAIRKYGVENFTWEVLVECENEEQLSKAEEFYFEFYNSIDCKKGYNLLYFR